MATATAAFTEQGDHDHETVLPHFGNCRRILDCRGCRRQCLDPLGYVDRTARDLKLQRHRKLFWRQLHARCHTDRTERKHLHPSKHRFPLTASEPPLEPVRFERRPRQLSNSSTEENRHACFVQIFIADPKPGRFGSYRRGCARVVERADADTLSPACAQVMPRAEALKNCAVAAGVMPK